MCCQLCFSPVCAAKHVFPIGSTFWEKNIIFSKFYGKNMIGSTFWEKDRMACTVWGKNMTDSTSGKKT
jgi:hypothetical protein